MALIRNHDLAQNYLFEPITAVKENSEIVPLAVGQAAWFLFVPAVIVLGIEGTVQPATWNRKEADMTPGVDVNAYHEEGFILLRGLYSPEVVDAIKRELAAMAGKFDSFAEGAIQFEDNHATIAKHSTNPLDWIRKLNYPAMSSSEYLMKLFLDAMSSLPLVCKELIHAEDLRLVYLSCFAKPPRGGAEIPWHQDQAIWPIWMDTALSGWIALDEATEENGCLQFVPKSHQWGMQKHGQYEGKIHESIRIEDHTGAIPVSVPMAPGDVVFFGGKAWHHSEPNRSEKRRLGMPVVYASSREIEAGLCCNDWMASKLALEKPMACVPLDASARRFYEECPLLR